MKGMVTVATTISSFAPHGTTSVGSSGARRPGAVVANVPVRRWQNYVLEPEACT
jgi:hypothetical protein